MKTSLYQPVRLIISLEYAQRQQLRSLAVQQQCSIAELVREALGTLLASRSEQAEADPRDAASEIAWESLTDSERLLMLQVQQGPCTIELLCGRGFGVTAVMVDLLTLELKGAVRHSRGVYESTGAVRAPLEQNGPGPGQ